MRYRSMVVLAGLTTLFASAQADDWPTYQQNHRRTGYSSEAVDVSRLKPMWVWRSPAAPQPAWAGPAKWDAYAGRRNLPSMRNYDPVFHVVAVGDRVWFGSTADDSVRCLDADTGETIWTFTADGPVRNAPTWHGGRIYFGSDDGHAYCLRARDGRLVWKHRPAQSEQTVIQDGRVISLWPCRTGVLVANGVAYFGCGMLPWKPAYLCAVDAETGGGGDTRTRGKTKC